MGAPCNESAYSDEKDRHGVFMKVGSTCNKLANQGERDKVKEKSKSREKL